MNLMKKRPEAKQENLVRLQQSHHPHCMICGASHMGHKLQFRVCPEDGGVEAWFLCDETLQGYSGIIHGGVVSTLLDAAMANCLFAHDIVGVTGELTVRFLMPATIGRFAKVRAWLHSGSSMLWVLGAELVQDGTLLAKGTGKFLRKDQRTVTSAHRESASETA